ncbi:hypothetical protein [Pseudorhodoferax sp.]|uniref:hypothetical protein n=1 Tax=Pseudorhodoferax sp. TaxID=1993553 RepID=UPI0039E55A26
MSANPEILPGPARGRKTASALAALGCAGLGLWLAWQHPLAPVLVSSALVAWLLAAWRWPGLWLAVVPAAVPLLSLAPWTGWIAADESDLLLLAALAAGHARLALGQGAPAPACRDWRDALPALLGLSLLAGLALAWTDAQRLPQHEAGAYTSFANSLRVGKAMAYALLAVPLLRAALAHSPQVAQRRLGAGMVAGLTGLMLGVLWERAAIPGLLNFGLDYRTVGLFWEMHVGGAAIDAYLALAVPFAVWAVRASRRPLAWLGAALLVQVLAYVCLTTFARGVYGAVLGGLVVAGVLLHRPPRVAAARPPWRGRANAVLCVLLVLEVLAMALASSFLADRLRDADNDFGSRVAHWSRGVSVLQAPRDWLAGIGLGRLPVRYAGLGRDGEFPGAAVVLDDDDGQRAGGRFLRLYGPPTRGQLAGRYALTQQVPLVPGERYRIAFDVRAAQPVQLRVLVCERHLLYEGGCQRRLVVYRPGAEPGWVRLEASLLGPPLQAGASWAPRRASLELAVARPGGVVDIDNLQLSAGPRTALLRNGGFEQGMARWYPVVDAYFLPWHIDNLYLEWLIERGALGLLVFLGAAGTALWRVSFGAARGQPAAPYLAAALAGGCALGLVSSVMDMPRVAFLFLLLLFFALYLPRPSGPSPSG